MKIERGLAPAQTRSPLASPRCFSPYESALYVSSYNPIRQNDLPPFPLFSLSLMAKTHSRSPSPGSKTGGPKRLKIGHQSHTSSTSTDVTNPVPGPATSQDVISCFAPDLFDADNVSRLASSYPTSEPFKHALIENLFGDDFLLQVKDECLNELHFTEKETDIYKVTNNPSHILLLLPSR